MTKALFLGNSYTFCNRMPWIVEKLAESGGKELHVEMVTEGGVTFEWHFNNPDSMEAIKEAKWDFIVLQNHSLGPTENREDMDKYGLLLGEEVKKSGAQAVLFMTWARQHIPEMQEEITDAYCSLAEKIGAKVAPVGIAWKNAFSAKPDLVLHTSDKSHPNPMGSYLAACVFFAAFYNESPEGLTGKIEIDGEEIICLSDDEARFFQSIAWEVFSGLIG